MAESTPRLVVADLDVRTRRLEKALADSERRTERSANAMAAATGRVSKRMSADMDRAASSIDRAFGSLKSFGTGFVGGLAAGAVAEFTSSIQGAIKSVADLKAGSQQAGIGVEAFQRLRAAATQAKVGTDALVDGLKELQLRTDEYVQTGSGSAAESLRRLGYDADTLKAKLRDVPAFFLDIIARVQQLDQAARIRVLDELFGGTGGEQFIRLADLGADKVRQIGREAQDAGRIIDSDLVERAALLDQQFNQIAETIRINVVAAVVQAAKSMDPLIARAAALDSSLTNLWNNPNLKNFNKFMFGGYAYPDPVNDTAEMDREARRGAAFSSLGGEAAPAVPAPIDQSNLPPVPYRPPNLLDFDPNAGAGGGGRGSSGRSAGAAAVRSERDAVAELIQELEKELALVGASDQERNVANNLRRAGAEATDAEKVKIQALTVAIEQQREAQEKANRAGDAIKGIGGDALRGIVSDLMAGKSAADAFASALDRVAQRLVDMAIDQLLANIGFNLTGAALGVPVAGGVWSEGGWTGPGSKYQPAGVVHADEFVFSKAAVQRAGVANLERMHQGLKYGWAEGGAVGAALMRSAQPASSAAAPIVNISSPITVNGSAGTPEQNQDLAERMRREMEGGMRGLIASEIAAQMRPGGMLRQRAY